MWIVVVLVVVMLVVLVLVVVVVVVVGKWCRAFPGVRKSEKGLFRTYALK